MTQQKNNNQKFLNGRHLAIFFLDADPSGADLLQKAANLYPK
ncbi:MAG: hypothetical protein ACRCWB_08975 [Enterovibrio sp.]